MIHRMGRHVRDAILGAVLVEEMRAQPIEHSLVWLK
jgi:hypothetical protein